MKFKDIFKTKNPVIGMVHFPPLLGYEGFPGIEICFQKSMNDAKTLKKGGVDAVMFENNYDIPHHEFVKPDTAEMIIYLIKRISKKLSIPFGVNVLWNDYKIALSAAKITGASFIRVPVFVDSVETDYGKIFAKPKEIINFRKRIEVEKIALFTDIHVKHAKMIEQKTISESAKEAKREGSDSLIITGKWTGVAPNLADLQEAREAVGKDFPILIGSGVTKDNISNLSAYADGVIVGTSLKTGRIQSKGKEVNLKAWEEVIDLEKTKELIKTIKNL